MTQCAPDRAARFNPGPGVIVSEISSIMAFLFAAFRLDFLEGLLHRQQIGAGVLITALAIAFALGAAHALTPGHGKTIVAAYLVGSRGTLRHAAFLGAVVTFTHTITVFILGVMTLFLVERVAPERLTRVLGMISGLSIVAVGAWMLYKRIRHAHDHHSHHDHSHHDHHHHHHHSHEHGSLVALGVSGGLVPCESALVLLLSAIALGRVGLGLALLAAFSAGLAIVLMGIGMLAIYAKQLLPEGRGKTMRWLPVASGVVVIGVGIVMTAANLM